MVEFRTWQLETAIVASILAGSAAAAGGALRDWICAFAMLASFAHAQVSDRLAEHAALTDAFARQMTGARSLASCWRWSRRYFVAKELAWLVAFAMIRAWPALVGVVVFLLYPVWRGVYRRRLSSRKDVRLGL